VLHPSQVIIHRPRFNTAYFAGLTDNEARSAYNEMVKKLHTYFVDEMGGSDEAFRLIMSTPFSQPRMLSDEEISGLGLRGRDPAFEEYAEAKLSAKYGPRRWASLKACMVQYDSSEDWEEYQACKARVLQFAPSSAEIEVLESAPDDFVSIK
jgi:hypothetical protein